MCLGSLKLCVRATCVLYNILVVSPYVLSRAGGQRHRVAQTWEPTGSHRAKRNRTLLLVALEQGPGLLVGCVSRPGHKVQRSYSVFRLIGDQPVRYSKATYHVQKDACSAVNNWQQGPRGT